MREREGGKRERERERERGRNIEGRRRERDGENREGILYLSVQIMKSKIIIKKIVS